MSDELIINSTTRQGKYEELLPQLKSLLDGETDLIANLGNVCAALRDVIGFLWVGFYFVRGNELVLGPFQGPVACTRIAKGRGVCGAAWEQKKTILVGDVDNFPGHIACSSQSKSEIVLPIFKEKEVIAVFDVDSDRLNDFNETDERYLKAIIELIRFNA